MLPCWGVYDRDSSSCSVSYGRPLLMCKSGCATTSWKYNLDGDDDISAGRRWVCFSFSVCFGRGVCVFCRAICLSGSRTDSYPHQASRSISNEAASHLSGLNRACGINHSSPSLICPYETVMTGPSKGNFPVKLNAKEVEVFWKIAHIDWTGPLTTWW